MYIRSLLAMAGLAPSKDVWSETTNVVAFGDSYSYVQGTAGRQNFSFIGDYTHLAFSSKTLLNNKIVQSQTGTAEGGPNWLEHLTGCGVDAGLTLPMNCDVKLFDFAFAGADIGNSHAPQHKAYTVPMVNQTQQFLTYAQPVLANITTPSSTLVTFWIGTNDIADTVLSPLPPKTLYTDMITTQFTAVQSMYDAGYRNFLLLNLAPLDKAPPNVKKVHKLPTSNRVSRWNSILKDQASTFKSNNPDSEVALFDANTFLNNILKNPSQYGISDTTGYCAAYNQPNVMTNPEQYGCLSMDQYFWFNKAHMSSHVHELLAAEIQTFLKGGS